MKTNHILILVAFMLSFTACTDVVDVDVPTAPARLVIEASIDWEKGTSGASQEIILSMTAPYFGSLENTEVTGASVQITNDTSGAVFVFEDQNDGRYTTSSFVPVLGQSYTLEVIHEGVTYVAQESMQSVVPISEVNQSVEDGFNDEALEVNVFFDDPADEENYYFFRFQEQGDLLPELLDISDEFTNGNQMHIFYEKEDDDDINQTEFEPGDVVSIKMHGISQRYYNYIRLLIEQYESTGDPFSTTPVPLRGNCANPADPDNYAYGYFRLSEVVQTTYTFQ